MSTAKCLKCDSQNLISNDRCGLCQASLPRLYAGRTGFKYFDLIKPLPDDSISQVFLAQDTYLAKKCIIREYIADSRDNNVVVRLEKAEEPFKGLNSPGKPQIRVFSDEEHYFVVEYVEVNSDSDYQGYRNELNEETAMDFLNDVLSVLEPLHVGMIFHGNLIPANILKRKSGGTFQLINFSVFGDAIQYKDDGNGNFVPSTDHIPPYAPEERRQGVLHPASDIYMLGLTALCLLANKSPEDAYQEFFKHDTNSWVWQLDSLGEPLEDILKQMLSPSHSDRFQTVSELRLALNGHSSSPSVEGPLSYPDGYEREYKPSVNPFSAAQTRPLISVLPPSQPEPTPPPQPAPSASDELRGQGIPYPSAGSVGGGFGAVTRPIVEKLIVEKPEVEQGPAIIQEDSLPPKEDAEAVRKREQIYSHFPPGLANLLKRFGVKIEKPLHVLGLILSVLLPTAALIAYLMNDTPSLQPIIPDKQSPRRGENVQLSVIPYDADGDKLTYEWSASAGQIQGQGARATLDTSTIDLGTQISLPVNIKLTVYDKYYSSDSEETTVIVRGNNNPVVESLGLLNSGEIRAGAILSFEAKAADDVDHDKLQFDWQSDREQEHLHHNGQNRATLSTAGLVGISLPVQILITVKVMDSSGGSDTESMPVTVLPQLVAEKRPTPVAPQPPRVTAQPERVVSPVLRKRATASDRYLSKASSLEKKRDYNGAIQALDEGILKETDYKKLAEMQRMKERLQRAKSKLNN